MEVVGWSLLHSVWQGALVALLLWVVLRVVRETRPHLRYAVGVLALAVILVLPVLNYRATVALWQGHRSWLFATAEHVIRGQIAEGRPDPDAVTAELRHRHALIWGDAGPIARVAEDGRGPARALAWIWVAGVLLLGGRLLLDSRRARQLAETGDPDARWRDAGRAVAGHIGVRPVRVRVTDRVTVPALVGWRWPVVLVPPNAPTEPEEMAAVLAHELAHVRRNDGLFNLLQTVADVLLFFSPAAWWVSARIREERECSCDLTAITAVPGGLAAYARTLLNLENGRRPAAVVALNGGSLVRRVRRLHAWTRDTRPIHWRNAAAAATLAVAASLAPRSASPVPLAARVSATSLMLRDLDGMRVVVRTIIPPTPTLRDASGSCSTPNRGREA